MLPKLSVLLSCRNTFLHERTFGALVALFSWFAIALPSFAQDAFTSAEAAYNAGLLRINDGNLAAARQPLEAALKLAKTDEFRLRISRTLLVPYRELQEIEPMQKAAEYVIANSPQAAERSLTRMTLLSFIHRRGKLDVALEGYEARLKETPEDGTVLYLLSEAYARYKSDPLRSAECAEKLTAVERKLGKNLDVAEQAQLAQQYVRLAKLKEAAELYETIAPLDGHLQAWHFKEAAAAWLKAGERSKAINAANKAAAAEPEKRGALLTYFWHRGLADIYLDCDEPALAIPQYQKALASCTIAGYLKDSQAKLLQAEKQLNLRGFVGTWVVTRSTGWAAELVPNFPAGLFFEVPRGTVRFETKRAVLEPGTRPAKIYDLAFDADRQPARLTLTSKAHTYRYIVERQGDKLSLCAYQRGGADDWPADFQAPEKDARIWNLEVLRLLKGKTQKERELEADVLRAREALQGTWDVIAGEEHGIAIPQGKIKAKAIALTIDDAEINFTRADRPIAVKGQLVLDPNKRPFWMDWANLAEGDRVLPGVKGIYVLERARDASNMLWPGAAEGIHDSARAPIG